jgi:hypothetical protein
MREISGNEAIKLLHPEVITVSLRKSDGDGCGEIGIEALKSLAADEYVIGLVGGRGRLCQIRLTVSPDRAFRSLGETSASVKDALHTDANITVVRSEKTLPRDASHKKHHKEHCFAWPHMSHQRFR